MKINLQLYSLRDESEKDILGTLEKVKKIGFDGVEFAGFFGVPAEETKAKLDELGLEGVSAHIPYPELTENLDFNINYLKTVGAKFIICPGADLVDTESAEKLADIFNDIGKKCYENGLMLGYHNHNREFTKDANGNLPIEVFAKNINPLYVCLETDVYWVEYADMDPYSYVEANKDLCKILHFKQMGPEAKENVSATDGIIDFDKLAGICDAVYVYEQEQYPNGTPLECMAESIKYFKK